MTTTGSFQFLNVKHLFQTPLRCCEPPDLVMDRKTFSFRLPFVKDEIGEYIKEC
jgi:hypothetical protein